MADFVRLSGELPAVNMDHVVEVWEGHLEDTVVLLMDDGREKILSGDEAKRVRVWLRNNAGLIII